jgi:rRNA maturation endonuclease Nob1
MRVSNRFPGRCHACGRQVKEFEGYAEKASRGRRWLLWCMGCFNESDNSGPEDRCCGDRAYEDRCAEAVGRDY